MKKNLLLILLAVGITVSAFGGYYLHKNNYLQQTIRCRKTDLRKFPNHRKNQKQKSREKDTYGGFWLGEMKTDKFLPTD